MSAGLLNILEFSSVFLLILVVPLSGCFQIFLGFSVFLNFFPKSLQPATNDGYNCHFLSNLFIFIVGKASFLVREDAKDSRRERKKEKKKEEENSIDIPKTKWLLDSAGVMEVFIPKSLLN